jgi:hypothetical protein
VGVRLGVAACAYRRLDQIHGNVQGE